MAMVLDIRQPPSRLAGGRFDDRPPEIRYFGVISIELGKPVREAKALERLRHGAEHEFGNAIRRPIQSVFSW